MENFYNFSLFIAILFLMLLNLLSLHIIKGKDQMWKREGGGIIKMHAIYSKFYFVLN